MGHHIADQAAALSGSASAPATDGNVHLPVFISSDRIAVPPTAVELLRTAIQRRKDERDVTEQLRAVVAPICSEARRAHAMPEHVIVSIKELCRSLPEFAGIRGATERGEFLERVVKLAIEEYYRG